MQEPQGHAVRLPAHTRAYATAAVHVAVPVVLIRAARVSGPAVHIGTGVGGDGAAVEQQTGHHADEGAEHKNVDRFRIAVSSMKVGGVSSTESCVSHWRPG